MSTTRPSERDGRPASGRATWCAALVALGLVGCAVEIPEFRFGDDAVAFHSDAPVTFSPALLDVMARHPLGLEAELGFESPPVNHGHYMDRDDVRRVCRVDRPACAIGADSLSVHPLHQHELVHAYLSRWSPPVAFVEGVAEVFGEMASLDVPHTLSFAELVSSERFRAVGDRGIPLYDPASAFVSFLLDRSGGPAFLRFYSRASDGDDVASLNRHAEEAFGASLEALHAEWQALPPTPAHRIVRRLLECSAPALALGADEPLRLVRGVGNGVYASRGGDHRTFTLTEARRVRFTVRAIAPGLTVGSCERGPTPTFERDDGGAAFELPAGRYFVEVTGVFPEPEDGELDATLRVELL